MTLGPIEILVVGFPENKFTGAIIPELQRVVESGVITIVDGLFVSKDNDENTTYVEFDELGAGHEISELSEILDRTEGLLADDDVTALSSDLAPNSSAAILVFEHTWATALHSAVGDAGGVSLSYTRVPRDVVNEILTTVPEIDEAKDI